MPGAAVPRFDSVTIDCPDPAALARFYGELLEWPVPEAAGDGEYVAIDPPGGGTAIDFQGGCQASWPRTGRTLPCSRQMHFDLAVDDLDAAHELGDRPGCPPYSAPGRSSGSTPTRSATRSASAPGESGGQARAGYILLARATWQSSGILASPVVAAIRTPAQASARP